MHEGNTHTGSVDQTVRVEAVEMLEHLEVNLLDYEQRFYQNINDVSLLHAVFRSAHNLKGTLALIGETAASGLIHTLETYFDRIRNATIEPEASIIGQCLTAVDLIQRRLEDGQDDILPDMHDLQQLLEGFLNESRPTEKRAATLDLPLTPAELALLEQARAEGLAVYQVDKVISSNITKEAFEELPIFEDIRMAGTYITTYPPFEQLHRSTAETVVQILFASAIPAGELTYLIFDPFRPLAGGSSAPEGTLPAPRPGKPVEPTPEHTHETTRRRILIAEDDFISRFTLSEILSEYGICEVAVDGNEAVQAFESRVNQGTPYDLVCLDIMMPGSDGYETLRRMRRIEEDHSIAGLSRSNIIMTTALNQMDSVLLAFNEQCDAYLVKPISGEQIRNQLKKLQLIA